jgi:hypothetical protein
MGSLRLMRSNSPGNTESVCITRENREKTEKENRENLDHRTGNCSPAYGGNRCEYASG